VTDGHAGIRGWEIATGMSRKRADSRGKVKKRGEGRAFPRSESSLMSDDLSYSYAGVLANIEFIERVLFLLTGYEQGKDDRSKESCRD